jgi:hypothetical protein
MSNKKDFFRQMKKEGSKRWTIPMDSVDHLENTIEIAEQVLDELKRITRQKIPVYLRVLHARRVIEDANYLTKLRANGNDDTQHRSYKGAV